MALISKTFDTGIRAGRIRDAFQERLERKRRLGTQDMLEIQADVVMNDAHFFTPQIVTALRNAQRTDAPAALHALAQDARVQEAVGRLASWDQPSPTGIQAGYDASDVEGRRGTPSSVEIANSVAATVYSAWSSQVIMQTLVSTLGPRNLPTFSPQAEAFTALQRLLRVFPEHGGVGASGFDAETSLPGGGSGAMDTPFRANLLPRWLTNDTVPLHGDLVDLLSHAHDVMILVPAQD